MKRSKISALAAVLAAALLLSSCAGAPAAPEKMEEEPVSSESLYVKKVDGLSEDFILGMDVSSILAEERSGVVYRGFDGAERDLFATLAQCGINTIRVRVWNDPYDAAGNGYGGGNCDVSAAAEIGRRAAENGMKLLVDFHYSDFWADPAKQMVPKAWEGMSLEEKTEALYAFTLESLKEIRAGGADIGMVQIGNETNGGLAGEKIWMNIIWHLMAAGCRAVREFDPGIRIAVHFANPENTELCLNRASKLEYYDLDYDIYAVSYYPWWHGTLENLKSLLRTVKDTYGKDVMVAETSYAYTLEDTDFSGNTIGEGSACDKPWPITVQGQSNEIRDVAEAVHDIGGLGLFYWEGAWITVGTSSKEENSALWEQYGSGWASRAAGEYDPKDAGRYYGGSACDNQALFGADGRALESLQVFRLLGEGNEVPLQADSIGEASVSFDLGKEIILPETVSAVMNDGSAQEVPVTWEIPPEGLDSSRERTFTVKGEAQGLEAACQVSVSRFNYAKNPSFEEEDLSMWVCEDLGQAQELYCEDKKNDSRTENRHWHFYSASPATGHFALGQEVELAPGTWEYRISIMGGGGGGQEIYSYVKLDGEEIARQDSGITSWNSWDTPRITFTCQEGQKVVCGISVRCDGAGAWGKIDDMVVCGAEQ